MERIDASECKQIERENIGQIDVLEGKIDYLRKVISLWRYREDLTNKG